MNKNNSFKNYYGITALLLLVFIFPFKAYAATPTCWAIDDDTATLYQFTMDTSNPQPPTTIATSRVNEGEGLAWRPSTNELFMWDGTTTYVLNATTGADVRNFTADLSPGTRVEGSTFYVDPVTQNEELWIVVEDYTGSDRDDRYLIRIDPDTGANISSVGPLFGGYNDPSVDYGKDTGGLAIDPITKQFWITNDGLTRGIYMLDDTTGEVGAGSNFNPSEVDGEALSFADDGELYTESDEGPSNDRYIWQIDGVAGNITRAAGPFPGSGDVEAAACNGGARVFEAPTGGSITIIKDATPDDPQDFAFTATGTGVSNFTLDDDSDGTLSNTQTFTGLSDGAYSFTETAVANWTLAGISCTGATNSTVTTNATGVDITLSDGEDITCTFYNNTHTCPAGQLLNQVSITANESETTYANNTAAACLEVTGGSCSLTASAVVSSCTNVGSDTDATNDTFTFDLTVQGTNTNGSTTYSYTSNSANISGSGTYSATAETDGAFVISSTTSPFSLTIQDDNDASCSTTVTNLIAPATCSSASPQVDLELVKTASPTSVLSGETVTYTLTLTNNGPNDATGIEVIDNLPAGVTYISDTPSQGSYDQGTGIWTVGDIINAANATLDITVTVD